MGREQRAKQKTVKPIGQTAILEQAEYEALVRRLEGVDLAQARANQIVAEAVQKRDALYAEIATKYALPAKPSHIQWNDETREIAVKGAQ